MTLNTDICINLREQCIIFWGCCKRILAFLCALCSSCASMIFVFKVRVRRRRRSVHRMHGVALCRKWRGRLTMTSMNSWTIFSTEVLLLCAVSCILLYKSFMFGLVQVEVDHSLFSPKEWALYSRLRDRLRRWKRACRPPPCRAPVSVVGFEVLICSAVMQFFSANKSFSYYKPHPKNWLLRGHE